MAKEWENSWENRDLIDVIESFEEEVIHINDVIDLIKWQILWFTNDLSSSEKKVRKIAELIDWLGWSNELHNISEELLTIIQDTKTTSLQSVWDIEQSIDKLWKTREELTNKKETAFKDPLTWANNRFKYANDLKWIKFSLSTCEIKEISYAITSIDNLIELNNEHWTGIWDSILKTYVKELTNFVDTVMLTELITIYRFWWNRFIIIWRIEKDSFVNLIEQFRNYLHWKKYVIKWSKKKVNFTISWWISWTKDVSWVDTLYDEADKNLFVASTSWMNQIVS